MADALTDSELPKEVSNLTHRNTLEFPDYGDRIQNIITLGLGFNTKILGKHIHLNLNKYT